MIRSKQKFWEELHVLVARLRGRAAGARAAADGGRSAYAEAFELAAQDLLDLLDKAAGGEAGYAWVAASFPPDTVLTAGELAAALSITPKALAMSKVPVSYVFGKQAPRYVWREVISYLQSTSEKS